MPQIQAIRQTSISSFDLEDNQQLYPCMRLPQQGEGLYLLPMTVSQLLSWQLRDTTDIKPELNEAPNLLMPVRLLRLKPDGSTQPLREGCWLYVFQDGYLWREIRLPQGYMTMQMDVNLSLHAGKDQRPAQCLGDENLTLAYRVNGENPEYRLAFSEIQWSWSQIQALGGMHPEDPRNSEGEDLQTSTTLEALEKRTCLVPLTDEDMDDCRAQVLSGPSQPDVPAEPQVDPEALTLPHLLIVDTLQDARDLKEQQDELIALQNAGLESLQTGQLGLARMIQDLTADGDRLKLAQHLAPERYDRQLLQAWDNLSDQLPERLEAAEQDLLAYLQQDAFTLAISDYLQSDDLLTSELGLTFFTQLTQHLVMPESLSWLYDLLDDQQKERHPVYSVARGEKEALNRQLVFRASAGEEGLPTEDEERLQGLELPDRLALIGLLPTTLDLLVGKYAETISRRYGPQTGSFLDALGTRFTQWTGIKLEKVTSPIRSWLGRGQRAVTGAYSYLPQSVTTALNRIVEQTVSQLIPKDRSLESLIQELDNSRAVQGGVLGVLGSLMLINAGIALNQAWSTNGENSENNLAAAAASASVTAFIMDKSMKLAPQPLVREASSQALRESTNYQKNYLSSRFSISKFVHHAAFTAVYRLFVLVAGALEVGLGVWRAVRGFQTGNTGVMLGAGLEAIGAALILTSTLMFIGVIAGPFFWIALLGASILASGSLLRIFSEYTPLKEIIRFGWFGSRPYNRFGSFPFQQPEAYEDYQKAIDFYAEALAFLEQDSNNTLPELIQPDLSEELTEITKTLFHFKAEIKVHELHDDSYILPRGEPIPRPDHALIELHVTLGAFTPIDTRLSGHIQVNGWQIPLHECYVIELRETADREHNPAPQYLRFITQVPRNAVSRGVRATAWLDPDGSGQIQVPEEPEVYRWSFINRVPWSFPARNNLGSITQSEWRRLKGLAVMSPAGEPETGVLVEGPDGCHVLPRDQALFHPLFSYRQGAW